MDSDPQISLNYSDPADPDNNHAPDVQVPGAEARLCSLSLEDSGIGSKDERLERSGSLPPDFYDAGADIEVGNEDAPTAAAVAREGSSQGEIAWLEGSEMSREAPPSPSSSGYAGEMGSSGASSGIGEEEVDGGGSVSPDDREKGKRRLDEEEYLRLKEQYSQSSGAEWTSSDASSWPSDFMLWSKALGGKKNGRTYELGAQGYAFEAQSSYTSSSDSTGQTMKNVLRNQDELMTLISQLEIQTQQQQREDIIRRMTQHMTQLQQEVARLLAQQQQQQQLSRRRTKRMMVVSLVGAEKASLHPEDMLLLSNFILSTESFRTSESFSPICLPRYNPTAFVDTYLTLLSTNPDAFYHLKDCRFQIETVLVKSNILSEVEKSMLSSL